MNCQIVSFAWLETSASFFHLHEETFPRNTHVKSTQTNDCIRQTIEHNKAYSYPVTVAILAQGTHWAVATSQAFCSHRDRAPPACARLIIQTLDTHLRNHLRARGAFCRLSYRVALSHPPSPCGATESRNRRSLQLADGFVPQC